MGDKFQIENNRYNRNHGFLICQEFLELLIIIIEMYLISFFRTKTQKPSAIHE